MILSVHTAQHLALERAGVRMLNTPDVWNNEQFEWHSSG